MTDTEFMVHILTEICDYAKANEMDPDDTIRTICGNFIAMLQISSFRNWEPGNVCPTQPEIIRCEDCEFGRWDVFDRGMWCTRHPDYDVEENDFCSRAKRRSKQDDTD